MQTESELTASAEPLPLELAGSDPPCVRADTGGF